MELKGETIFIASKHKHLVIYTNVSTLGEQKILYYEDIAVAKNEATVLLNKEPNASAHVFQLRSAMASKIEIDTNDYNM